MATMTDAMLVAASKSANSYGKHLYADAVHGAFSLGMGFAFDDAQGAQYSGILDDKICEYCKRLDGLVIPINHPDFIKKRFHPPQHRRCRCLWIAIHKSEPDVVFTWDELKPTNEELLDLYPKAHYHKWVAKSKSPSDTVMDRVAAKLLGRYRSMGPDPYMQVTTHPMMRAWLLGTLMGIMISGSLAIRKNMIKRHQDRELESLMAQADPYSGYQDALAP